MVFAGRRGRSILGDPVRLTHRRGVCVAGRVPRGPGMGLMSGRPWIAVAWLMASLDHPLGDSFPRVDATWLGSSGLFDQDADLICPSTRRMVSSSLPGTIGLVKWAANPASRHRAMSSSIP